jgi:hypothetical protein
MPQIPSIGRIVLYQLSAQDAVVVNRRRTTGQSIKERMVLVPVEWADGAQAHIGNEVREGQTFPMLIVKVWGDTPEAAVNGQVFLDGTDVLWVTSVTRMDDGPRSWDWPPRV